MLSCLTSAHCEKIVTMDQNVGLQAFMEKPRIGKTLPPANPGIMFSPTLGSIQRSVHRLSQFHTHGWLLCLGVLVWQSDVDVANCIGVEEGSTHICDGDQERVLNSQNVFLTRNRVGFSEFPAEVLPRRSVRPLCGAPPYRPDANENVGLRRFLCRYRFT